MFQYPALSLAIITTLASSAISAGEVVNLQALARIKEQAAQHAQVEHTVKQLADVFGPRLTGTPRYLQMAEWTADTLRGWGIDDVRIEPFGKDLRGWEVERFSAAMTSPVFMAIDAQPVCCSRSIDGVVTGKPIIVDFYDMNALRMLSGNLEGRILLHPNVVPEPDEAGSRFTQAQLDRAGARIHPNVPDGLDGPGSDNTYVERLEAADDSAGRALARFLIDEGVGGMIRSSSAPAGLVNNRFDAGFVEFPYVTDPRPIPLFVIPREQHARLLTLVELGHTPTLELELKTNYYDDPDTHVNVIAEIPGTDLAEQVVIIGAHLDSVEMATGASDNAVGAAALMEVMRIISVLGLEPRRTIRLALWGGEEYGLIGSREYVRENYGDIMTGRFNQNQRRVTAYFNHDNNGHDIRGILLVGHEAIKPIFEEYFAPFASLGADTVSVENAGGTDILVFDAAGIPSFEWIYDPKYYFSHQLHTNIDTTDLIDFDSVRRNVALITSVVYHTAMRDEQLPRKFGQP